MDAAQTPGAVVAAAVCGPFVLTVVAIGLATTTLARRARREDSGAGSKAAAALVTSLLHVVPISLAQATDYASDVIVASSLLASGDAQQAALGWIAVGALGLSLVFAWVSLLGFACEETYSPYGEDHKLEPHQLLTAALLAPFNLHVLYLGVVYSRAIAGTDEGGSDSPKYQSSVVRDAQAARDLGRERAAGGGGGGGDRRGRWHGERAAVGVALDHVPVDELRPLHAGDGQRLGERRNMQRAPGPAT